MNSNVNAMWDLALRIRGFLTHSGWSLQRQARGMAFFHAPAALGFEGIYSVALPVSDTVPGGEKLVFDTADALVAIYGYADVGDLLEEAAAVADRSQAVRILSRFIDVSTEQGAVPLWALIAHLSYLEASLCLAAKFKLKDADLNVDLVAQRFAKQCRFLQTQQGSFIAAIEVPRSVLLSPTMHGGRALTSSEVSSAWFAAIQFLNERIMNGDCSFESRATFRDATALFDVALLESLTKLVTVTRMNCIEFSIEIGQQLKISPTGPPTPGAIARLEAFERFFGREVS